ncbi:hypothetical protein A7U60_g8452 [Sanghuangporus baumii]|uniref:Asl1-like glycosyl hydrolase catalytic domain-containing protein n=1 Tax=Sanghuangporus baumii TaxID=108892 RepID=A0A9Q5N3D3_SANBA|nr:hypothetical protein A7U60_g8452 [Sanghuangporus baumii]
MAFGKLFNLFALSSLAVLVCNLQASPVTALAHDGHHMVKVKRAHGHDAVLKHKRDSSQRCKQRPSSSATQTPATTSTSDVTQAPSTSSSDQSSPDQSSSSVSTAPTSTSSVSNSGSGKVGLAWPNGNDDSLRNFVTDNVQYIYTWSEQCPSLASELGLTCMPMLWGNAADKLESFKSTVVAGYANIAMGFNEVNEAGQANMDVDTAVSVWKEYLEPLVDEGYSLLSPCTSSNPNGFDWMIDFFDKCDGCNVAGLTLHYYGTSAQDMIDYIEKWHNQFNIPVWITEFACQNFNTAYENNGQQCSESQVWEFYETIVNFVESTDYVVSWSPFGFMKDMQGVNELDRLMQDDGTPTALGSAIINLSFN